jgi:hypothetical protein
MSDQEKYKHCKAYLNTFELLKTALEKANPADVKSFAQDNSTILEIIFEEGKIDPCLDIGQMQFDQTNIKKVFTHCKLYTLLLKIIRYCCLKAPQFCNIMMTNIATNVLKRIHIRFNELKSCSLYVPKPYI